VSDLFLIACMWAAVAIVSIYILRRRAQDRTVSAAPQPAQSYAPTSGRRSSGGLFRFKESKSPSPEEGLLSSLRAALGEAGLEGAGVHGRLPLSSLVEARQGVGARQRQEAAAMLDGRWVDAVVDLPDPEEGILCVFFESVVRRRGEEGDEEGSAVWICADAGARILKIDPKRSLDPKILSERILALLEEGSKPAAAVRRL